MGSFNKDEIVRLNVGGKCFITNRGTLTGVHARGSMLEAMFSERNLDLSCPFDNEGTYFIDRDGKLFRFILFFLRSGIIPLQPNFAELELLIKEAEYFLLDHMVEQLREVSASSTLKKRKTSNKMRARTISLESHFSSIATDSYNMDDEVDNAADDEYDEEMMAQHLTFDPRLFATDPEF